MEWAACEICPNEPLCFSFFDKSSNDPDLTVKATRISISPRYLLLPSCPGLLFKGNHLEAKREKTIN